VLGASFAAGGRYRGVVVGIGPTRHPFGALDEWLLLVTARRVTAQLDTVALHLDRLADQQLVLDARLAGELQQQLIGRFAPVADLDISAVLTPARHVGGDLYGWDSNADGTTVAVADVSGKGASAALLMASVQASLRHAFALGKSRPADVIEHVRAENEDVLERTSRLVTMAVARFDRDGTVGIASAGQSPVVVRLAGKSELVTPHIPPLGVPGRLVTESVFALTGDDAVLIGTDGLIDQCDEYGSPFGVEGVLEAVDCARGGVDHMVEQILARVVGHRGAGQQEDDIALVVVRRKDLNPC
jgi:sigma-B regulation protein RsbU (phosphoserine phosphatase)